MIAVSRRENLQSLQLEVRTPTVDGQADTVNARISVEHDVGAGAVRIRVERQEDDPQVEVVIP